MVTTLAFTLSSHSAWSPARFVGVGAPTADPIIGLLITLVILKITWDSWNTVRHTRGAWDTPDDIRAIHHPHGSSISP